MAVTHHFKISKIMPRKTVIALSDNDPYPQRLIILDADFVFQTKGIKQVEIFKNRYGDTGTFPTEEFIKVYRQFKDVTQRFSTAVISSNNSLYK